nr:Chain E, Synthetic peptide [synthetic construct]
GKQNCLKLATK